MKKQQQKENKIKERTLHATEVQKNKKIHEMKKQFQLIVNIIFCHNNPFTSSKPYVGCHASIGIVSAWSVYIM